MTTGITRKAQLFWKVSAALALLPPEPNRGPGARLAKSKHRKRTRLAVTGVEFYMAPNYPRDRDEISVQRLCDPHPVSVRNAMLDSLARPGDLNR